MKRYLLPLVLLVSCTTPAADPTEIESFLESFAADARSSDAMRIAANYASDIRILEDGRVAYTSREEIQTAIEQFPSDGEVSLVFRETDIRILGPDHALVQTLFDQSIGSFSFSGAISMVLVRGTDGWEAVRVHTSSFRPRPEYGSDADSSP